MLISDRQHFELTNIFATNEPFPQQTRHRIILPEPIDRPAGRRAFHVNMAFEPGCHNNWQIHHAATGGGQVLICTAGSGCYQQQSNPTVSPTPSSAVVIPAGIKHQHEAKRDSWFSHIAVAPDGTEMSTQRMEPVSDERYAGMGN